MGRITLLLFAGIIALGFLPSLAVSGPKIAVHVQPRNVGKAATCDVAPTVPCSQFQTSATTNVSYDVYVIAAEASAATGVGSATFGIQYDSALGMFNLGLCGDLQFPGGGWPASGGGTVITFDVINNCQTTDYGEGVQATLCWFYIYAYGAGDFQITPRNFVAVPDLGLTDCAANEIDIFPGDVGTVSFSPGGISSGINPCSGIPQDTTPPFLVSAGYLPSPDRIDVVFNESVGFGAEAMANYEVFRTASPSTTIPLTGAIANGNTVSLTLGATLPTPGVLHTVRVNNVEDSAGNSIAPNSEIQFTIPLTDPASPTVLGVTGNRGTTVVSVIFSEPMGPNVTTLSSYSLVGNALTIPINLVTQTLTSGVRLSLGQTLQSGPHSLTVSQVEDVSGNPIAPTTVPFTVGGSGRPSDPRIAVHVQPANTAKTGVCSEAPVSACVDFSTEGQLTTPYDLYVVAMDKNNTGGSLAGATFGIDYDPGLGVLGATLCGDLQFPGNGWPASGGGTVVTFDAINNCQTADFGDGPRAVLYAFYVYAYSASSFSITPRNYVSQPDLKVAGCSSAESTVSYPLFAGVAGFGTAGYNSCIPDAPPTRVESTTWGNIKRQFSGKEDDGTTP